METRFIHLTVIQNLDLYVAVYILYIIRLNEIVQCTSNQLHLPKICSTLAEVCFVCIWDGV